MPPSTKSKIKIAIGGMCLDKPVGQAIVLSLIFSLSLCLVSSVSSGHSDPLSGWLIDLTMGNGLGLNDVAVRDGLYRRNSDLPVLLVIYNFALSLVAGLVAIILFFRFPLPWCLILPVVLASVVMILSAMIWSTIEVLIPTSAPILSIIFGTFSAWFLTRMGLPDRANLVRPPGKQELGDLTGTSAPEKILPPDGRFISNGTSEPIYSGEIESTPLENDRSSIGRYEIIRTIGKGAMGEVFLGRDPHINRLTAVKAVEFEDSFAEDDIEQIKAKFFREAESAGTLSHPHIVTIYDAGEDDGSAYIAMEFLEGTTLLRFARRQRLLPLRRLIHYMFQVAEALDYAHSQGVTHRDIKPANIILTHSDQIKITDFGIAHIAASSQTQTGVVKGTPYYMSPEQFSGQKVDGRSDIFSLGTTMFQLLTGSLPFYAESPALLMNQIMNFPHPNPRAINPRVLPAMVRIVDKALEKDRENRYQTAKDLARDLRKLNKRIKTALRKDRARNPSASQSPSAKYRQ